jgi:DNA-binding IclR family transcriptional regulator
MASTSPEGAATPPKPERLLGSVMKCLTLLDLLAVQSGPVGVSELARALGARRGTVHQQLQTLIAAGWAEAAGDAKYRLSLRAVSIGAAVLEQADLGSRILPTLASLAAATGETASIAVLDHDAAMIVQRVAADRELKADIKPGTRMPLATSASGRVLLAFCAEHERAALRAAGTRLPAQTILTRARELGYAAQHDEYLRGMSSIAVPIAGTKLGSIALAVTAPSGRYDEELALRGLDGAAQEIAGLLSGAVVGPRLTGATAVTE